MDFKTKKLKTFEKEIAKLCWPASIAFAKQFISDLIDEMESNLFLKDIVTKTRIDTLRQIMELKNTDDNDDYVDMIWVKDIKDKAKEIWGININ